MMFLLLLLLQESARTAIVPNSMAIHTWFIVLAIGSFLAWSISYSIQLQKEALARKKGREGMVRLKEKLLDEIADVEARREAGTVSEQQYKKELKDLKFRLAKILEKLGQPPKRAVQDQQR